MPIFHYKCRGCGEVSELLVARFDSKVECPKCGSSALEKLPSRFSAVQSRAAASCANREFCPSGRECRGSCGRDCGL